MSEERWEEEQHLLSATPAPATTFHLKWFLNYRKKLKSVKACCLVLSAVYTNESSQRLTDPPDQSLDDSVLSLEMFSLFRVCFHFHFCKNIWKEKWETDILWSQNRIYVLLTRREREQWWRDGRMLCFSDKYSRQPHSNIVSLSQSQLSSVETSFLHFPNFNPRREVKNTVSVMNVIKTPSNKYNMFSAECMMTWHSCGWHMFCVHVLDSIG